MLYYTDLCALGGGVSREQVPEGSTLFMCSFHASDSCSILISARLFTLSCVPRSVLACEPRHAFEESSRKFPKRIGL